MAKSILTNVRIFAGAVDITGVTNRIEVAPAADVKDVTTFGSVDASGVLWQDNLAGLDSAQITAAGFFEAGVGSFIDDDQWLNFGGIGPWTFVPNASTPGSLAYVVNAVRTNYTPFAGAPGDAAGYNAVAASSGPFARGMVLVSPGTPLTATGTGTIVQVGAVPAGRAMRASLHVVSIAGTTPTLSAVLQSAAAIGFASPTTRATFQTVNGPAGSRSAEYIAGTVGAITDQFWRISYTITGTTPSFVALAAVGIG